MGVAYVLDRIDTFVRSVDDSFGGIKTVAWFHGRSLLAFFLPVPVYIFIVFGPSLDRNADGDIVWRGGFTAVLLLTGALFLQLIYFLQNRWRGMAWLHLGLITTLFFATWTIGKDSVQASSDLYRHYYGLLALIALLVSVPFAGFLRHRKLFTLRARDIIKFKTAFDAKHVVAKGSLKSFDIWDVIGAFILVVLRKPLHVVTPVAFVVLAVSSDHLKLWAIIALFLSLALFAMSIYDPSRDAFVRLVHRTFLSGGTLLVTLAITTLAALRLAGVDYFTTVLDTGSKLTIFSYIFSTYSLFWFYDFWINQAILDLLGKFDSFQTKSGTIQRHGGGRVAVITRINGDRKRIFEPAAFLMRIAQTAPEPMRASLQNEATRAEQRFRTFACVCLLVFAIVLFFIGAYLHHLDQSPGLTAAGVTAGSTKAPIFNLSTHLKSSGSEPVIMLAASGGGTRAALYTTAVLHGLLRLGKIDRLVLTSGVSGGSAALAYFATHRPSLLQNDEAIWHQMRETLSSPFIDDVLAGAAEWRVVSRVRIGQLLTESFKRRFLNTAVSGQETDKRTTLGEITDIGLIFNASLCGSPAIDGSSGHEASAACAGGRLMITNLSSRFDMKPASEDYGWGLDLPCEIVNDPSTSLFAAASLSANFPPVFSNAAVALDGKRFWVTDGGAVENRGIISILLVLAEALETIQTETKNLGKRQELTDIRLIVADASAFQPDYKSDRGLGAKFGASEQVANRLIRELITRVGQLHKSISGRDSGIQVVYLPMPEAMRAAGTFGTHWMMPATVTIKDPLSGDANRRGIELESGDLKELIDAMFSKEYSINYIEHRWPKLDAKRIMEETKQPWGKLEAGLK